ncbi:MAG: hypothetical protein HQK52_11745 [Oligoflexia bacterium]|nr:hypothetical protein [Oligoflexia bacterium]
MISVNIEHKQQEFNSAMKRYEQDKAYFYFNKFISIAIIGLQAILIICVAKSDISCNAHLVILLMAYVLADFINGLIHMYMDNNDHYNWIGGPLVANFHLHHKKILYDKKPLPIVYFNETGSKVWLLPTLLLVVVLAWMHLISPALVAFFMYFGIFSSIAEVSHYICHMLNSPWAKLLGDLHILLSKRHHGKHHSADNKNYAFLNGMTDPLLNIIASKYFLGYKKNTDLHFSTYEISKSSETNNQERR